MNKDEYQKLVKKHEPREDKLHNTIYAFLIGGTVGFIVEGIIVLLMNIYNINRVTASTWTCLIVIFVSSLFTALGFFDNWMTKAKAGLLLPTTGFAHSVSSSALDYKKEGLITGLGANFFKLAGSVILYGILSAFILAIVKVIISG
ncbi:MAG: SpoVA/SpoVAEb family sporulation membrane protein [Firmicutes bacterium]|nr:SpoVA/SpoVAEb family sporulation membrane protein [Bacillota bacterium]